MKVLVTGANGQLGYDVVKELQKRNIECYGAMRQDFDIVDFEAVEKFIVSYMPDAIIHCAAYTAVDKACAIWLMLRQQKILPKFAKK